MELIERQAAIAKIQALEVMAVSEMDRVYNQALHTAIAVVKGMPSAQPETAKRIVGCARNGMTMWYQCDMCHEPVDEKDAFCSGCGRRLVDD